MPVPAVRLYLRVRRSDGTRAYLEPVFTGNHKLRPMYALVQGVPTLCSDGVYHVRYQDGGRRVWESVGSDPQLALTKKTKRERALAAKAVGIALADDQAKPEEPTKRNLNAAIEEFLAEVRAHRLPKTVSAHTVTLQTFRQSFAGEQLEDISRKDILDYMLYLRDRGNGARTVANRIAHLKCFLTSCEVVWPLTKRDRPRYTEKLVSAYHRMDIGAMLRVADRNEADLVHFLLGTGCREQEVQYATWADVDFEGGAFRIREKNDTIKFVPKDREEGDIPIPDSLVARLRERRTRDPKGRLIFPTEKGQPDGHLLRRIKRLGRRAGLNCGHCVTKRGKSCAHGPTCSRMELHRFRKTYATMHHQAGVPARTIQGWLRHSSLDTTLRYLALGDSTSAKTRDMVNRTFADLAA